MKAYISFHLSHLLIWGLMLLGAWAVISGEFKHLENDFAAEHTLGMEQAFGGRK